MRSDMRSVPDLKSTKHNDKLHQLQNTLCSHHCGMFTGVLKLISSNFNITIFYLVKILKHKTRVCRTMTIQIHQWRWVIITCIHGKPKIGYNATWQDILDTLEYNHYTSANIKHTVISAGHDCSAKCSAKKNSSLTYGNDNNGHCTNEWNWQKSITRTNWGKVTELLRDQMCRNKVPKKNYQ